MHPKCAAALADKDGKKKLMLKGRTEVTAGKREDLHKKRKEKDNDTFEKIFRRHRKNRMFRRPVWSNARR